MPTIKDVARQAGVSATTVSIIMNGKAEERKIPAATCARVMEAARQVGYHPDMGARRLRRGGNNSPVVAFFWPLDYRLPILSSFINAISKELHRLKVPCELVVQTFENDHLDRSISSLKDNYYSAVIIGACSVGDLKHLEALRLRIPVILINRVSPLYTSVGVDNLWIGRHAAEMIYKKGYRDIALVAANERYLQTRRRTKAFLNRVAELGITIKPEHILLHSGDIHGGADAAVQYACLQERPKMIFFEASTMAMGALSAFHRLGINCPRDVEVLAVCMVGYEQSLYSLPSLSIIDLPNEKIAIQVVELLLQQLRSAEWTPEHRTVDCDIILRDSFRLPSIEPECDAEQERSAAL